jgi:hypothetical protein
VSPRRGSGSAIGLLSRKDFAAFAVQNAQSYRSRRPSEIRGGDDGCRRIGRLNLDFRQSYRSAIWRRADKLDSERARRGGDYARQLLCRRQPGKGSRLARGGHFAIGNENGSKPPAWAA